MSPTPSEIPRCLRETFQIEQLHEAQEQAIEHIFNGHNTLVTLPTGYGKSLIYQLPALMLRGTSLIISPLLSLIEDQIQALQENKRKTFSVSRWDSTLSDEQRNDTLDALTRGEIKLLYTSPESLKRRDLLEVLKLIPIGLIAIDEAHCYSEWGHQFRPSYLDLPQLIRKLKPHSCLALTATATRQVASQLRKAFRIKVAHHVQRPPHRDNLSYTAIPSAPEDKMQHLLAILSKQQHLPAIVYAMRQLDCESIAAALKQQGFSALAYHAGMSSVARSKVQRAFLDDSAQIIVATIAFGMGIDKANIRSIIHYHMPKSPEAWMQETGRAGRDQLPAHTYTLPAENDFLDLENFIHARRAPLARLRQFLDQFLTNEPTVSPYHARLQLDIPATTFDVLLAHLERQKFVSFSHISWRYVHLRTLSNAAFKLSSYPLKTRRAIKQILGTSSQWKPAERPPRYDLWQAQQDFGIKPLQLYRTLQELQDIGEMKAIFSGWYCHYKLLKPLEDIRAHLPHIAQDWHNYLETQLTQATTRLAEVRRIATSRACIAQQFAKWHSTPLARPCGKCSSCKKQPRPRRLPSATPPEISSLLPLIQAYLKQPKRRIHTAEQLTKFLAGIPSPRNKHYWLNRHPLYGCLAGHSYADISLHSEIFLPSH